MTGRASQRPAGSHRPDVPDRATGADRTLDALELATAVLMRNFELLRRRSDVYTELDRAEYLLLRTLDRGEPMDIASLAGALGLDPSTAGRQVAALEAKGLVARRPAATDRRRSLVTPTGDGRRRMSATRDRRRHATADLLAGWSLDDLRDLARLLTCYNETVARRYLTPAGHERAPAPATVPG